MKPRIQPILRIQKFKVDSVLHGKNRPRHYFRILAENGEIVAQSEAYTTARARNSTVSLLVGAKMEEEK